MEGSRVGKADRPVESARLGIAERGPIRLPAEPFDRFVQQLDEPPPPEFEALRDRETRWDR